MRVYELAKELNIKSVDLVNKIRKDWNLPIRSYMEVLTEDIEKQIRKNIKEEQKPKEDVKKTTIRKTTTKRVAVKKTVARKTITKKPTSTTKKEPLSKVMIKKADVPSESAPKPVIKKNIIRRKAVAVKPLSVQKEEVKEKLKPKEEKQTSTEVKTITSLKEDLQSLPVSEDLIKEEERKKVKKLSEKEESEKRFIAADFRKREVIFQPKKKRSLAQSTSSKKTQITTPKTHKRVIRLQDSLSVQDLSHQMGIKSHKLVDQLKKIGVSAKLDTQLDFDTVSLMAGEFNFETKSTKRTFDHMMKELQFGNSSATPQACPPVVTVMGHVDHGKTTLLDTLRKTRVVQKESGGITQHIGAYSLPVKNSFITFIDTPGHEAFASLRARGAQITNIVVLVVAAEDGVNSQTVEAIEHAKLAKVPIIVAINKMDKPGADAQKVKQQISEHGLVPEEWGGDVICVPISALKGTGTQELLDQILLVAEMQEIKANPKQSSKGVIIESRMEKGRGWVATLIVQNGTLKKSDCIMTPSLVCRVRQMVSDSGKNISSVSPGFPVEICGFEKAPQVGDVFFSVKNEKQAREFLTQQKPHAEGKENPVASIEDLLMQQSKKTKELVLVVKADVAGSLEALKHSLSKITSDEVKLNIIHSALGGISENDVLLAVPSKGEIFGFNVRPDSKTEKLAKNHGVPIWTYTVIYELLDGVKKRAIGVLDPDIIDETTGKAEVREVFSVSSKGSIAGSFVLSGKVGRQNFARLIRDGKIIYTGKIDSLRRFKNDVKEVAEQFECGIGLENFNDMKPGDLIESYIKKETARTEL